MNSTEEYSAKLNEEALETVAGGKKEPVGPGTDIQWDDPRCVRAGDRAIIFGGQFQGCDLYPQATKDLVMQLCQKFRQYINTQEHFNLGMAKDTYFHIASLFCYSKSIVAEAGWQIFTQVFYSIFAD